MVRQGLHFLPSCVFIAIYFMCNPTWTFQVPVDGQTRAASTSAFRECSIFSVQLVTQGLQLTVAILHELCWRLGGGATLRWLLAVFPPTFVEELLSFLYSVGLRIKIRHLWWPKLCQTMFTLSLLTKPFSKLVRRHAVLVYSFNL